MTYNSKRWLAIIFMMFALGALLLTKKVNRLYAGAMLGNLDSMFELGLEYQRTPGMYVKTDYNKGYYWLKKAAIKGHTPSIISLWRAWEVTNPTEAIRYVEIGANKKNIQCMSILGIAYEKGMYGLPKDTVKAQQLFREIERIESERK